MRKPHLELIVRHRVFSGACYVSLHSRLEACTTRASTRCTSPCFNTASDYSACARCSTTIGRWCALCSVGLSLGVRYRGAEVAAGSSLWLCFGIGDGGLIVRASAVLKSQRPEAQKTDPAVGGPVVLWFGGSSKVPHVGIQTKRGPSIFRWNLLPGYWPLGL
jgi:hypothetical protein